MQAIKEIEELFLSQPKAEEIAKQYFQRFSQADLTWMELEELAVKSPSISNEINQIRQRYASARDRLNRAFSKDFLKEYPYWFGGQKLSMTVHFLNKYLKPILQDGKKILLVVVDGMGTHLWRSFRSDLEREHWVVEEEPICALLPSLTGVSRAALFSGLNPHKLYPELVEEAEDQFALNEEKNLKESLKEFKVAFFRKKDLTDNFQEMLETISEGKADLVTVIINQVDDAIKSPPGTPFSLRLRDYSYLDSILKHVKGKGWKILLISDHGFTPHYGGKGQEPKGAVKVLDRCAIVNESGIALGDFLIASDLVYDFGGKVALADAFGKRLSLQPKRGYHGGSGLEEVIVSVVSLEEGEIKPKLLLNFLNIPNEIEEDKEVIFFLEAKAEVLVRDLSIRVLLPDGKEIRLIHPELLAQGWRQWAIQWRARMPLDRIPEAYQALITAIIESPLSLSGEKAEATVVVKPRRGKYQSFVDEMLS